MRDGKKRLSDEWCKKWGLPPFAVQLTLNAVVPGWGLRQVWLGQGGQQPSILARTTVGDVVESCKLDTTPATAFSGQATALGVELHRVGSVDTLPALPALPRDSEVGHQTSGGSLTTPTPPAVTRPLVLLANGEVIEAGYTRPTTWTGPPIDYLLQNSR